MHQPALKEWCTLLSAHGHDHFQESLISFPANKDVIRHCPVLLPSSKLVLCVLVTAIAVTPIVLCSHLCSHTTINLYVCVCVGVNFMVRSNFFQVRVLCQTSTSHQIIAVAANVLEIATS